MTELATCPVCEEEWSERHFTFSGQFPEHKRKGWDPPPCNACFRERYPRRTVACTVCGEKFRTTGNSKTPTHRKCR